MVNILDAFLRLDPQVSIDGRKYMVETCVTKTIQTPVLILRILTLQVGNKRQFQLVENPRDTLLSLGIISGSVPLTGSGCYLQS